MPKQITIRGTDGRPYRLMVKRDDTRKDTRFRFTNMVRRLLSSHNSARKRNLIIEIILQFLFRLLQEDMGGYRV